MSSLDLLSLSLSVASINNAHNLFRVWDDSILSIEARSGRGLLLPLSYPASFRCVVSPIAFMKFNTGEYSIEIEKIVKVDC